MFQSTPESESDSIECFQNYTASEVFVQGLAGMVDQQDVEAMIRAQKQMLQRFEKTNEMLTNCNALSSNRYKLASADLKKHISLLLGMKKDLNYIFKKIKIIKERLATNYPAAYEEACKQNQRIQEEGEEKKTEEESKKDESIPEFATSSSDDGTNSKDDSSPCSTDTENMLCNLSLPNYPTRGRPTQSENPTRLQAKHWAHFPKHIPPTNKKQHPAKRCHVCMKHNIRSETTWQCKTSLVPLHIPKCFEKYHTLKNY